MARKYNTRREDGRICVKVYVGRRPDGEKQYKFVYGSTQKEADEKALEIKLALQKGLDIAADRDSFGDWAELWAELKYPSISDSWKNVYKGCLDKLSPLNYAPISKLRPADFQKIINELARKNPNTGKPASRRMLDAVKGVAVQICQFAIDNRIMDYNPAAPVRVPETKPARKRRAITDEERVWIDETPHRAQIAAMIMLYAGLRRGELIPLTWRDIDLEAKTISVSKSVEMVNGQPQLKEGGKTENSTRVVDIPEKLVAFLKSQKKESLLVCPSSSGKLLSAMGWKRLWSSYMTELNIRYGDFSNVVRWSNGKKMEIHVIGEKDKYNPNGIPMVIDGFTAHDLRHTFATMLYFAGVDILTAKEQLGHSDVKTTMNIYTHLDKEYKRRSMDKLDAYLKIPFNEGSQRGVK